MCELCERDAYTYQLKTCERCWARWILRLSPIAKRAEWKRIEGLPKDEKERKHELDH